MAVTFEVDGKTIHLGGVAKGSGMIHPDMATMLSFVTTDAAVDPGFLQTVLSEVTDISYNMMTVDGDSSTNDTVLLLANGQAGNRSVTAGTAEAETFKAALTQVCVEI